MGIRGSESRMSVLSTDRIASSDWTLVVFVALLCLSGIRQAVLRFLNVPFKTRVGVENEMFHFRSLCDGNWFPTFGVSWNSSSGHLPLRRNAYPLEGITILRQRVGAC